MKRTITILTIVVIAMTITGTTSAQSRGGYGRSGYNGSYNRGYGGGYGNSGLQIYVDGVAVQTGSFLDTIVASGKIDDALDIARANREKPKPTITEMEQIVHRAQARPKHNITIENAELRKENLELQRGILELQIEILKLQRQLLELQKQITTQQPKQ